MLSRRHIRIKVLQSLYSYWNSGGELTKDYVEKDLNHNIYKLYDLYLYLLVFLKELGQFVAQYDEQTKSRHLPINNQLKQQLRLYENPVMQVLLNSKELESKLEWKQIAWNGDNDLLRKTFYDLKNTDTYQDYVNSGSNERFEDVEMLKYIVKNYPDQFGILKQHFEETFFNWHDDNKLAKQMVTKTINNIGRNPESKEFLVPFATNEQENIDFARDLFRITIDQSESLESLIHDKTGKFEPSQLSYVDFLILKMGACEFMNFSSIPTKVTLNEYIEIAKHYSAPKSKKFINGVLDNLRKELEKKGKVVKSDRGLYEK